MSPRDVHDVDPHAQSETGAHVQTRMGLGHVYLLTLENVPIIESMWFQEISLIIEIFTEVQPRPTCS